jgi:hypothetical protein
MSYYRLYFMCRASGHIERFEEIEAVDDLAAVRTAREQAGRQPLELWCQSRKVKRFETSVLVAASHHQPAE